MPPAQNFRDTGTIIATGQKILAASFKVLDAERLKNNHSPAGRTTAWPAILLEIAEIEEGMPNSLKLRYSTRQIEDAWRICELYSKLPYPALDKKLTLRKARTKDSWKKLGLRYGLEWHECRRISDTVVLHLMRQAAQI